MAITAKSGGSTQREIVPSGNYIARCFQMLHIGTYEDEYLGEPKIVNKVRISWELPTETRVFNEDKGEQPMVIDKEYTLSLNDKANHTTDLSNWRGKAFTDKEKISFDILNLLGKTCMLNIIHKTTATGRDYARVGGIAPVPKGVPVPDQINPTSIFDYDENFDMDRVEKLPDFIKDKIKSSSEYTERRMELEQVDIVAQVSVGEDKEESSELPF